MTLGTYLKSIDFFYNPFWEIMNYRRIKSNGKRISDFYDLTKANSEPKISITLDKTDVPVAHGKLSKIKSTHKGAL